MTYVDTTSALREPLISGRAHDTVNRLFRALGQVGGASLVPFGVKRSTSELKPLEECLRMVQDKISEVSMHLPKGFATALNKQFANLMDDDAWEDEDELLSPVALTSFITILLLTETRRRPGIGTNGRGSITSSWTVGENRLLVECLPNGRTSLIVSRQRDDREVERAAFDSVRPERLPEVIAPFNPEVWFDG